MYKVWLILFFISPIHAKNTRVVTKVATVTKKQKTVDLYSEFMLYLYYQQGEVQAHKIRNNRPDKTTFKQMKSNVGEDFAGTLNTKSFKAYWYNKFVKAWNNQKPSVYDKYYNQYSNPRWLKTVAYIESKEKHNDFKGYYQGLFQLSKPLRKSCKTVSDHVNVANNYRNYFIDKFKIY